MVSGNVLKVQIRNWFKIQTSTANDPLKIVKHFTERFSWSFRQLSTVKPCKSSKSSFHNILKHSTRWLILIDFWEAFHVYQRRARKFILTIVEENLVLVYLRLSWSEKVLFTKAITRKKQIYVCFFFLCRFTRVTRHTEADSNWIEWRRGGGSRAIMISWLCKPKLKLTRRFVPSFLVAFSVIVKYLYFVQGELFRVKAQGGWIVLSNRFVFFANLWKRFRQSS